MFAVLHAVFLLDFRNFQFKNVLLWNNLFFSETAL